MTDATYQHENLWESFPNKSAKYIRYDSDTVHDTGSANLIHFIPIVRFVERAT